MTYMSIWGAALAFTTGHGESGGLGVKQGISRRDIAADQFGSASGNQAAEQPKSALQS